MDDDECEEIPVGQVRLSVAVFEPASGVTATMSITLPDNLPRLAPSARELTPWRDMPRQVRLAGALGMDAYRSALGLAASLTAEHDHAPAEAGEQS